MVRKIDGNQSHASGYTGDGNVQCHSYGFQIEGEVPLDFTATHLDLVEVAEALPGSKLCFIRRHSYLDVGARSHLHMEAQFSLDLVRDFIGMLPGVNEIYCVFDSGHWFSHPFSSPSEPSWSHLRVAPTPAPR